MTKSLVSRAELARRCDVAPASITEAARGWPPEAFEGKRVNLAHPVVAAYLKKHTAPKPVAVAQGVDPLWEHALAACHDSGQWTVTYVKRTFHIGHTRAKRIIDAFKLNELLPGMARHEPLKMPAKPRAEVEPPPQQTDETLDAVLAEVPEDLRELMNWSLYDLLTRFGTHTSFAVWLKSIKELEFIEEKRLKNAKTRGDLVDREIVDRVLGIFDTQHMRLLKDGAKSLASEAIGKHQAGVPVEEIELHLSSRMGTFITAAKNKVARLELTGRKY